MAFDGKNLWVANWEDGSVTELVAATGRQVATYTIGIGRQTLMASSSPDKVLFDGANIWVASIDGLTKLAASDGTVLATVQIDATGLAYDGTNIWATSCGGVSKIDPVDGTITATYPVAATREDLPAGAVRFSCVRDVLFDGNNIWIANGDTSVTKLDPKTGRGLRTVEIENRAGALAFDGKYIWIAPVESGVLTKVAASSGAVEGTYSAGPHPVAVTHDGTNIWVANRDGGPVMELAGDTGQILKTYDVGGSPEHLLFDGTNIWVSNYSHNTVTRITPPG